VPILREILNASPGNRNFTNGEIVVKYNPGTKTLSLVDLASSQLKLEATHNGSNWVSNSNLIGKMKPEDIDLLKAALIIVQAKSQELASPPVEIAQTSTFSSLIKPENVAVAVGNQPYEPESVER
ncbi:MAG: hypothetical protein WBM86_30655, partial [Waterburya sp.]